MPTSTTNDRHDLDRALKLEERKEALARKDSGFCEGGDNYQRGDIGRMLTDGDIDYLHQAMLDKDLQILEQMHLSDSLSEDRLDLTSPPTSPRPSQQQEVSPATRLPYEIICQIIGFINPKDQSTLWGCSGISRLWYSAAIPLLYRAPILDTENFVEFVSTICPSVTLIKPSPLAHFIQELDLSYVEDMSKPSLLPRLLRRVCPTLKKLVVPIGPFNMMSYQALSHCYELRLLDLSNVSHSMKSRELIETIKGLTKLRVFKFPRSPVFDRSGDSTIMHEWPSAMTGLFISGGIADNFFAQSKLPQDINELAISHCPFSRADHILRLLRRVPGFLTSLTINVPMPRLGHDCMNQLLHLLPQLENLCVAVDYITSDLFAPANCPFGHPLTWIDIPSSAMPGTEHKLKPDEIFIPIAELRLPRLRTVAVSRALQWEQRHPSDVEDLVFLLKGRADELRKEALKNREETSDLRMAGLWVFEECKSSRDWGRMGAKRIT